MNKSITPVLDVLGKTIIGKSEQLKLALTCLLSNGHLLIEDLPGMGKTSLSHALASAFGLAYSRIQFTSDLLPADMLGANIFDVQKQQFSFHPGPIFNEVVLADEINRASPKTQSALLEAMEERQVSLDGTTHTLPQPFFVIATQNPMHQAGTYPLPESQLDRFLMRITLGYPNWEAERTMLKRSGTTSGVMASSQPVSKQQLIAWQQEITQVHSANAIIDYILRLVSYSRESGEFANPLSPRASKAILVSARAWAWLHGRDHVIPEDVQEVFTAVAEHRLRGSATDSDMNSQFSGKLMAAVDPLAA
ncbi:AAA family ATPase [Alteromonas oceanisediminis]|uniref:AAA family ATPase n=1 Tax=Alteromonas oceanisediminis TaxID=2836180 RepID=UPI001BDA0A77|nr:MoxR family ATPase [Alteromonas oceanisediminis]MBT0587310.1 MoxR family ATPase [Alteromonas oceanisediminis]